MARKTSLPSKALKKTAGKQSAKDKRSRPAADIQHQIKIQKALYEIADAASAVTDMQSFYKRLHEIVGELMYAKNFFIALYDEQSDLITWPYYVDTVDIEKPAPTRLKDQHGGTAWVLKYGKTLAHVDDSVNAAIERGEAEQVGTVSDAIVVPLKSDGKTRGVLLVQSYKKETKYTAQDLDVLTFVAQHVAIALTRARAIEETRQRNAELAIINSVGEAMVKTLDVKTMARLVGDKVRDIFDADSVIVMLLDKHTNLIHVPYEYDKDEGGYIDYVEPFPLGTGLASKVIKSGEPLMLGTLEEEIANGAYFPPEIIEKGLGDLSQSWLGVPIIAKESVLGILALANARPRAFNENQLKLLQTLSSNVGVAIENARLFQEAQQRAAELATVNTVSSALISELDLDALIALVGEQIRTVFKADIVYVALLDKESDIINFPYQYGQQLDPIQFGEGLTSRIIQSSQPLLINQELEQQRQQLGVTLVGKQAQSYLGVPIFVSGAAIGVVSVQSTTQEGRFTENDQHLLSTIAANIGIALQNARLWEQEKIYRKALQRELEIGREIQAGFLPEELPLAEGWEIAASLMSAREVAGDFYDAFELPDGSIGLVIADVCDKGVGAALFMTLFRSLIRAAANLDYFEQTEQANVSHSTAERLRRAMRLTNNYIAETHQNSGMFATLFFGILDPCTGKLAYINGGHEPPLIIHAGNVREALNKTGPAVGAILNCCFEMLETQLHTGDMFFAYTDGVPDCRDPHGEFFGHERMLNLLQRTGMSAPELVKDMESELHRYIAHATQFDDITLLAVKRV